MKIRIYPDPILREKCSAVKEVTPEIRSTLKEMGQTMYLAQGIGLAGPQVGTSKQIIVFDVGEGLKSIVNPQIVKKSGSSVLEQGCLSFPGITVKVRRAAHVLVAGLDENGKNISLSAQGLLAQVVQHEIDHLHGRVIIDYAGFRDRLRLKRQLKELAATHMQDQNITCSENVKCL